MAANDVVLEINNISVCFDGFYALTDVRTRVMRNTVHFFIGPNGAGKTTLLDIICARTKPTAGTVIFHPKNKEPVRLTGMKEYKIVNEGVGRKFQVPSVFVNLSVEENMILALKGHKGIFDSIFRKTTKEELECIHNTLKRVSLDGKSGERAGSLAHGEKQWLEIAMQLVSEPEIIVIEHDMDFVKQAADIVTVLHEGKFLMEGNVNEVLADKTVQAVYLGRGGEHDA